VGADSSTEGGARSTAPTNRPPGNEPEGPVKNSDADGGEAVPRYRPFPGIKRNIYLNQPKER